MARPTLIMLPGLGSDGALFADQVRDLSDVADVRIGDTLQDDTLPAMAARVLAAAPDRFALAGLSMGGYLALEIMQQAADRVTRLALLDTSARADTAEAIAGREAAIAAIGQLPYERLARMSLPRLVAATANDAVRDAVVAMAVRVGADTYVRQQRAIMARPAAWSWLAGIAVPTLIVVGSDDVLTPVELARELAAAIPGARLVELPGSGHLPTMERPAETTAALREWLVA